MGRSPVIQSPHLDRVEQNLRSRPGHAHDFLGEDRRRLIEILTDDLGTVHALGLTHEAVADRLERITDAARKGLGDPILLEGRFRTEVQEARGKLPCPWGHPGLYRKSLVSLFRVDTGESLQWTDLSIHLVRAHGFYQGKGSAYRLEPADLKRILEL